MRTIIFDLDGTLINLNLNFNILLKKVQDLLQIDKKPVPFLETIVQYTKENRTLQNKVWNLIDQEEIKSVQDSQIFPETTQVLDRLKNIGYGITLVTLQGKKATNLLLKKFSLSKFFKLTITREDSFLRANQINITLNYLNLTKNEVIMVGDRLNDVKAAKSIGVPCILIRRRYNPLPDTIVIKSLLDLFQYL
ncbi:MAG: HAD family hydrolase [Candidatus Helarchaeota archaeon]